MKNTFLFSIIMLLMFNACNNIAGQSTITFTENEKLLELMISADEMADKQCIYDYMEIEFFIDSLIYEVAPLIKNRNTKGKLEIISSIIHDSLGFDYINVPFDSVSPQYGLLSEIISNRAGNCMGFTALYSVLCEQLDININVITYPKHIFIHFYENGNYYLEATNGEIYDDTEYLTEENDTIHINRWNLKSLNMQKMKSLYLYNASLILNKNKEYKLVNKLMSKSYELYDEPTYIGDLLAFSAFKLNDYETAIRIYKKLYNSSIENKSYKMNLNSTYIKWGNMYAADQEYISAIDKYKQAEKYIPGDPIAIGNMITVYNNTAVEYTKSGKYENAEKLLIKAYNIEQQNIIANSFSYLYITWGNEYFKRNEYSLAIDIYLKALKYSNDNNNNVMNNISAAYTNWGNVFYNNGKYNNAIEKYRIAIDWNENNFNAYKGLGSVYFEQKKYMKAAEYFKTCIKMGDKDGNSYYGAGAAYYNAKKFRKAKEILNLGLSISKDESIRRKILDLLKKING